MKRLILTIALIAGLLTSVACGGASSTAPITAPAPRPLSLPDSIPGSSGKGAEGSGSGSLGALPTVSQERMIVRNGSLSLVVKDVIKSRDEIAGLASRLDGYVVSSSISGVEQELRGNIAIRVPDDKFEQAMSELRCMAVRVNSENTSSQDVTEEYVDLQARLKNAEATESQYLALLDRATTVEEILKVQESLSRVRQEIEQLKGRIQYLERTSSTSLISVYLEPEFSSKPIVDTGWNFGEILKSAVRGLTAFGSWLLAFLIWALVFSPVWGGVIGILYLLWRWIEGKKKTPP